MDILKDSCQIKTTRKKVFSLRSLRKSLKFRPKIYSLILKLRHNIKQKIKLIKKLKQNSIKETDKQQIISTNNSKTDVEGHEKSTQTDIFSDKSVKNVNNSTDPKLSTNSEANGKPASPGWAISENAEKSIAEQVKEAAQSAIEESGMVYVESAGMYYDYKTGYYYSPDLGLYYHTDTGCYYYYSNDRKEFVFHSYPDKSKDTSTLVVPRKAKKHKKTATTSDVDNLTESLSQDGKPKKKRRKVAKEKSDETKDKDSKDDGNKEDRPEKKEEGTEEMNELEDGECSESEGEMSDTGSEASTSTASDDESVAKHHPPCMRIIIRETNLPKLKVGSLYLITKDGGTIGREGDHHALVIRDHNVSRGHLDIRYDMDRRGYFATDVGSKNGTMLNGVRMSESGLMSKPMEVIHGSVIQLGETKLLCHIHPGTDTCGHCEPGLIQETEEKEKKAAYTRTCSVQKQHQLELARLKNKYAPQPLAIEEKAYNDRAQARREQVGSSHSAEKTQAADIDTCIESENKGFKLLEKMGWSKGEGLGKDNQGETEPIPLISNEGKAGLGSTAGPAPPPKSKTLGPATLRLASKTKMLRPPAKAFQPEDDDDDN
ncbi:angiogenic factor with G patch and FHA domains 1 isoform X2 [Aricia agestis]|uniref:angiogenic factor with G patch and FHA domains 1 isoform X2 n=1 Tax=Aricia agestis TaxID=91739 RepID=UPI001C2033D1|nr:angiogenic factor with G patch and FHA domains 1 isoform X2 [Aricia agestis]